MFQTKVLPQTNKSPLFLNKMGSTHDDYLIGANEGFDLF